MPGFTMLAVIAHGLWTRIRFPHAARVAMMEDFAQGWIEKRCRRDAPFHVSEGEFLDALWSVYVGEGSKDFVDRTRELLDRKIEWRKALMGG